MSLNLVPSGKDLPHDINVIIEIPSHSDPIKYEVDKDSGSLFVDRFMGTAMHYPCNYGYIPHTLSDDGDPVDVLVKTPVPLMNGSVIRCRPIGVLKMTDEAGEDAKVLAVPVSKLTPLYDNVKSHEDISPIMLDRISHFFEHYKDLEPNKWVKINGWGGVDEAAKEIMESVARYEATSDKPRF
ncbi:MAG: inorganic pyrophosphatase [Cycloclasticus sp. symbiont of Poecilosclerida sp. M]|nr:MAG: inorganic pyrophosphatase [Cycloclasticus sp. symbiont of Poecilosclerida sp. M]